MAKLTLGLVVVFGGVNVLTWTASIPDEMTDGASRAPASVREERSLFQGSPRLEAQQESIYDLKCLGQSGGPLTVNSHQIRIVGRICDTPSTGSTEFRNIVATNTTNGFEGTVFLRPHEAFTSDFLFLDEGQNEVVVNGTAANGEIVSSHLVFIRQGKK